MIRDGVNVIKKEKEAHVWFRAMKSDWAFEENKASRKNTSFSGDAA